MRLQRQKRGDYDPKNDGAKCDECPLNGKQPTQCETKQNAKLIILGESPGRLEDREGVPFVGESGRLLSDLLDAVGASRARAHVTNAVLCRPPEKLKPKEWHKALQCCRPRLLKELENVPTKTILALGAKALQQTTGKAKILDWIGAPLPGLGKLGFGDYTILPALHPAFVLRTPQWGPVLQIHIARAWDVALGRLKSWEWPETVIDGRDALCQALQQLIDDGLPIAVDVETGGIDPFEDVLLNVGFANTKRMVSVMWDRVDAVVKYMVDKVLQSPLEKVFHNGQFDCVVFGANGMDVTNFKFDTLIAHSIVAPQLPHKLAIVSCIETAAPRWKDEFRVSGDDAGHNRFLNADPIQRAIYNARDCYMTVLLRDILLTRLEKVHKGIEQFTQRMNLVHLAIKMRQRGVSVDMDKYNEHKRTLRLKRIEALKKLRAFGKPLGQPFYNPDNARETRQLFTEGLGYVPSAKTATGQAKFDANVLTELCAHQDPKVKDLAWNILQYRKVNKLLKTYVTGTKMYKEVV